MSQVYITHATEKYLSVAHNLATSIREFSNIPIIIYCIDVKKRPISICNIKYDSKYLLLELPFLKKNYI